MKSNPLPLQAQSGALTVRVPSLEEHAWFDSVQRTPRPRSLRHPLERLAPEPGRNPAQALALDGKMIRDQIGPLTLAQHEDGTLQAVAVYDQKDGTPPRDGVFHFNAAALRW